MARERYLVGVDPSELLPDPKPEGPKNLKEKWENFWYHYKWWVAGIAFALLVICVVTGQMASTVHPDYRVVIVTENGLTSDATVGMTAALKAVADDQNGDGEVLVTVENLAMSSQNTLSQSNSVKLAAYFMSGEVLLYVFDAPCFEAKLQAVDGFDNFFEKLPTEMPGVSEQYGYWNWKGSAYQTCIWGKQLPENLYFGIRAPGGTAAGEDALAQYERDKRLLEAFLAVAYQ